MPHLGCKSFCWNCTHTGKKAPGLIAQGQRGLIHVWISLGQHGSWSRAYVSKCWSDRLTNHSRAQPCRSSSRGDYMVPPFHGYAAPPSADAPLLPKIVPRRLLRTGGAPCECGWRSSGFAQKQLQSLNASRLARTPCLLHQECRHHPKNLRLEGPGGVPQLPLFGNRLHLQPDDRHPRRRAHRASDVRAFTSFRRPSPQYNARMARPLRHGGT